MHYYQFHIGDYRKDTVHLVPIEHYIYRSLIDWYYLDESPLPKETQVVMRRLSLDFNYEKNLQNVLADFFKLTEKGWEHKRIKVDIADYHEQCEKNKLNGKLGGRPKKTQVVSSGLPDETQLEPKKTLTNNHKPLTINHTNTSMSPSTKADPVPYSDIITLYHDTLPTLPQVMKLTSKRKAQIRARWLAGDLPDLDTWKRFFEVVSVSDFLMGRTPRKAGHENWRPDIEWLTNETNFTKIWEQKYHRSK